ncbi:MAG: hypothetical protein HQK51_01945, partial [Oligoflexia bacterium]|nr:hypothetical protein [Oligoflexia bacterium]
MKMKMSKNKNNNESRNKNYPNLLKLKKIYLNFSFCFFFFFFFCFFLQFIITYPAFAINYKEFKGLINKLNLKFKTDLLARELIIKEDCGTQAKYN